MSKLDEFLDQCENYWATNPIGPETWTDQAVKKLVKIVRLYGGMPRSAEHEVYVNTKTGAIIEGKE